MLTEDADAGTRHGLATSTYSLLLFFLHPSPRARPQRTFNLYRRRRPLMVARASKPAHRLNRPSTGIRAWYQKAAAFNVESLFVKSRVPGPPRTVFVNEDLPQDYYDHKGRIKKEYVYKPNQVVTSKYTVITFLPRNLLEQFRRIANV